MKAAWHALLCLFACACTKPEKVSTPVAAPDAALPGTAPQITAKASGPKTSDLRGIYYRQSHSQDECNGWAMLRLDDGGVCELISGYRWPAASNCPMVKRPLKPADECRWRATDDSHLQISSPWEGARDVVFELRGQRLVDTREVSFGPAPAASCRVHACSPKDNSCTGSCAAGYKCELAEPPKNAVIMMHVPVIRLGICVAK